MKRKPSRISRRTTARLAVTQGDNANLPTKICPVCHHKFVPNASSQEYCSDNCKKVRFQQKIAEHSKRIQRNSKPRTRLSAEDKEFVRGIFMLPEHLRCMYTNMLNGPQLNYLDRLAEEAQTRKIVELVPAKKTNAYI